MTSLDSLSVSSSAKGVISGANHHVRFLRLSWAIRVPIALGLSGALLIAGCGGSQVTNFPISAQTPTSSDLSSPGPVCAKIGDSVRLYSRPQVNLQGCNFVGRRFNRDSNWGAADLRGTDFTGASLNFADFGFANLTSVNFSGATLESADFTNANVNGANFEGAILRCITDDGANWSEAFNVQIISRGSCLD